MLSYEIRPGCSRFAAAVFNLQGFYTSNSPSQTLMQNNNAAEGNLFTDWSKILVWYCTGDLHTGNHVATYVDLNDVGHTINHVGYANVKKYLSRLKATFCFGTSCTMPAPSRIVVAGSSADFLSALTEARAVRSSVRVLAQLSWFTLRQIRRATARALSAAPFDGRCAGGSGALVSSARFGQGAHRKLPPPPSVES
jgi:hypothetical protein